MSKHTFDGLFNKVHFILPIREKKHSSLKVLFILKVIYSAETAAAQFI